MTNSKILNNFTQDKFHREELADYLTRFIETRTSLPVNDNSLVIGLDSAWGTGKSSFLTMWKNKLEEENNHFEIIMYNAWEHDDYSDALIPLICSFGQIAGNNTSSIDEIINTIKVLGPRVVNAFAKGFTNFDFIEAMNALKNNDQMSKIIYEDYISSEGKKEAFKKLICKFTDNNKRLLIFIDELDRCRPTFAIETLEAVKHFFDLPNVIFVFSLDINQLQKSIETIYGKIDATGYLQRFFDCQISLPKPNSVWNYISEKLVYDGSPLIPEIDCLVGLTELWNLSIRDLNVICEAYLRYYRERMQVCDNSILSNRLLHLYFIARKYSDFEMFIDEINGGVFIDRNSPNFLKQTFGDPKLPEEQNYNSFYTEEYAQTKLSSLEFQKDSDSRESKLFSDDDWRQITIHKSSYTVAQAIMNIIDYGQVYPRK